MRNNNRLFLFLLSIPILISLACNTTPLNKVFSASDPVEPPPASVSPVIQQDTSGGFLELDCSMSGIIFNPINIAKYVDDIYDGPSLTCSYSTTGAHGLSETVYISIVAYKADQLEGFYQGLKENFTGYIDQANEWNAHPDLSAEMKNEITMLRDDSDGYVFLITKYANVQDCTKGDGYGVEKVNGKYLIKILFSSCESDAPGYLATFKYIQSIAEGAIKRIEAGAQP